MSTLTRTLTTADLQIRSEVDGRTIYGLAVPFNREATVDDGYGPFREVFRKGSFVKTIAEYGSKVKLLGNHNRQKFPLGKATKLEETDAGLMGEFKVSATREGDEALELVRDGVLDSFSVGFAPVPGKDRKSKGLVERLEVKLREVSLVAFPAYEGAAVHGVRAQLASHLSDEELERLLALAHDLGSPEEAQEMVAEVVGLPSKAQRQARAALVLRGHHWESQPRVPSGKDGGQWTAGGGSVPGKYGYDENDPAAKAAQSNLVFQQSFPKQWESPGEGVTFGVGGPKAVVWQSGGKGDDPVPSHLKVDGKQEPIATVMQKMEPGGLGPDGNQIILEDGRVFTTKGGLLVYTHKVHPNDAHVWGTHVWMTG